MSHAIRLVKETDLAEIFEIYDREVLERTATFETVPKTAAERDEWFRVHGADRYPALVAVEPLSDGGEAVVGWACVSPWSPRQAYARSAENSVYVRDDRMGRGIGRALMVALVTEARRVGIRVLIARITEGNPASLALHRKLEFQPIGTMREVGEKFGRILDVELLDLHI